MSDQLIIQQFEGQYNGYKNEMLNVIQSLRESRGPVEVLEPIQHGNSLSSSVQILFKRITNEQRHFDPNIKSQLERRKNNATREWKQLKTTFDELKSKYTTSQLSAADQALSRQQRQKMLHARDIQDDSSHSLTNTSNALEESLLIAGNTNRELDNQTETLHRISETVDDTNTSLTRSQRLLETMRRRVLTNKLLQAIVILSEIVILIGILFLKYYA